MKDFLIDAISHAALFLLGMATVVLFLATIICVSYGLAVLLKEGVCTWHLPVGIVCIALEWGVFKAIDD